MEGTRLKNLTGGPASDRDGWILRLGPEAATVIWIGFDNPKRISSGKRLESALNSLVREL